MMLASNYEVFSTARVENRAVVFRNRVDFDVETLYRNSRAISDMEQDKTIKIINSLTSLPLSQTVRIFEISWAELGNILNSHYNFEKFEDYNSIDVRAPYFLPEEEA